MRSPHNFPVTVQVPVPWDLQYFLTHATYPRRLIYLSRYEWQLEQHLPIFSPDFSSSCQFAEMFQLADGVVTFHSPWNCLWPMETHMNVAHAYVESWRWRHRLKTKRSTFCKVNLLLFVCYRTAARQYHALRLFYSPIVTMDQCAAVASPSFSVSYQVFVSI